MHRQSWQPSWLMLAAVVCISAGAQGCAGSQGNLESGAIESVGLEFALPAFPVDRPTERQANETTDSFIPGAFSWFATNGAEVNGSVMDITSNANQVEFAVYRHEVGFETTLDILAVDLSASGGAGAWICIADYAANRWQVHGPYFGQAVIPVDVGDFLSPDFINFFVGVIAFDGTVVSVASSTLIYEGVDPPLPSTYLDTMKANFDTNCMPCHNSATAESGIVLDSYWRAFEHADVALAKVLIDHDPGGGGTMTPEQKVVFQTWVNGGKDYGADVTYTSFVDNLTSMSCSPCHRSGRSDGGANFDTYANALAKGAAAWVRIENDSMPRFGPPLSDPNKDKWLAWVEQGLPE